MTLNIQSTAGAVPVPTDKAGQFTMQKVKVHRYVAGKRPEYALESDEEDEAGVGEQQPFVRLGQALSRGGIVMAGGPGGLKRPSGALMKPEEVKGEPEDSADSGPEFDEEMLAADPRLRRLLARKREVSSSSDEDEDRVMRHKRMREPELFGAEAGGTADSAESGSDVGSSDEEDLGEEEMERRREELRRKALQRRAEQEQELERMRMELQEEEEEEEELDLSEEEYTDSEDEYAPRLKPVFVRKRDRVTLMDAKAEPAVAQGEEEAEERRQMERRKQTLKIVEDEARREAEEERAQNEALELLDSEDEGDDEADYEAWKLRELKRIRREREQREAQQREKEGVDRIHNMTEDERREEFRRNPKVLTNKMPKGKYKFLQKYYHRGAFFLDNDEDVYKRDIAQPTLEDHFDKTVLPKVMQVKNFGRAGRTKYTHLVDQDTSQTDSPWYADTQQNLKFHLSRGGGMKQAFDRPSGQKKK